MSCGNITDIVVDLKCFKPNSNILPNQQAVYARVGFLCKESFNLISSEQAC